MKRKKYRYLGENSWGVGRLWLSERDQPTHMVVCTVYPGIILYLAAVGCFLFHLENKKHCRMLWCVIWPYVRLNY